MKVYELKTSYGKYHITLKKGTYLSNGSLYVRMVETTPKGKKIKNYFDDLTVNLMFSNANENKQYIDTNSLGNDILKWLKDNGIAKPTGEYGHSGFCTYPLYKFTKEALAEMEQI